MNNTRKLAIVAVAFAGLVAAASVEARGRDDVQFSVTIGAPFFSPPPLPVFAPAWGGYGRGHAYRQPTRWDRDGDGIPNRYDRVYNPRWDRDGDRVPNRYDHRDNRRPGHGGSRW